MPELPNGVPETESPDGKKKRKIAEDFLNEPKAPLEETWEPLEPHEVVTIAKPIRKGKDYYIDGQNTQLIFFFEIPTGGGKRATQITPRWCIFWIMIFYNLKIFRSRSI